MVKPDFRLLVCGGRDYGYRKTPEGKKVRYEPEIAFLERYLDTFAAHIRATTGRSILVIEGGATGADEFAREWAQARGLEYRTFPADWKKYNKAAGYVRNRQMLEEGRPEAVIAFKGGKGTRMMVAIAKGAGVPTRHIESG